MTAWLTNDLVFILILKQTKKIFDNSCDLGWQREVGPREDWQDQVRGYLALIMYGLCVHVYFRSLT